MDTNYDINSKIMQMNETWHIPRASLSGSSTSGGSSNSSNKSHSNPSTVTRHTRYIHQVGHTNLGFISNYDRNSQLERDVSRYPRGSSSDVHHYHYPTASSSSRLQKPNEMSSTSSKVNGSNKRGSRSSQGSTDSNSSTHSGASGSLLLTTANLERFAAIHKKTPLTGSDVRESRQNYNTNITGGVAAISASDNASVVQQQNTDAIIAIDPNLHFVKTKDVDSVSIASSTHFTMVNGMGGPPRKTKSGICSRGHQITVLILSMSTIFLIGILAAIYLLEMRARGMPQ